MYQLAKRLFTTALAFSLALGAAVPAYADSFELEGQGYLVLGADLTENQKETVLELLEVDNISNYEVSFVTHEEENAALSDYLDASVIGTKALSSILMIPQEEGSGISISSSNISYCTLQMYQNALISAGVKDVEVHIASPVYASGTCALVGAMNAYETISGEKLEEENVDTAVDELVTTGEVADVLGDKDQAAELIAYLKQEMIERDMDEDDLNAAVDKVCEEMGYELDEDMKQRIIDLLLKIKNTDIDIDALATQASELYNKVVALEEKMDSVTETATSFIAKASEWFQNMIGFFTSIVQTQNGTGDSTNSIESNDVGQPTR